MKHDWEGKNRDVKVCDMIFELGNMKSSFFLKNTEIIPTRNKVK